MMRLLLFILGLLAAVAPIQSGPGPGSSGRVPGISERSGASELQSQGAVRKERFLLGPRQGIGDSMGSARLLSSSFEGGKLLEFELELTDIATHVQRTFRSGSSADAASGSASGTFVFREWRRMANNRQDGRSLVVEGLPLWSASGWTAAAGSTCLLREWAGKAVRREQLTAPLNGLSMLQVIERERSIGLTGPRTESLPIFDGLECTWSEALLVRKTLVPGLVPGLHLLDVFPSSGARHSRWLFRGPELLAFLEGAVSGTRDLGPAPIVPVEGAEKPL